MSARRKSTQSIDSRILATIHGRGRGSVFVPADFLEIGSREAVDIALHRLSRKGTIRRLARGVYDFPERAPGARAALAIGRGSGQGAGRPRPHPPATGRGLCGERPGSLRASASEGGVPDGWPEPDGEDRPDDDPAPPDDRAEHGGGRTAERSSDPGPPRAGQRARDPGAARTPEADAPGRQAAGTPQGLRLAPAWMHPIFRELAEEEA